MAGKTKKQKVAALRDALVAARENIVLGQKTGSRVALDRAEAALCDAEQYLTRNDEERAELIEQTKAAIDRCRKTAALAAFIETQRLMTKLLTGNFSKPTKPAKKPEKAKKKVAKRRRSRDEDEE
jgi:Na+/phosphate symporter